MIYRLTTSLPTNFPIFYAQEVTGRSTDGRRTNFRFWPGPAVTGRGGGGRLIWTFIRRRGRGAPPCTRWPRTGSRRTCWKCPGCRESSCPTITSARRTRSTAGRTPGSKATAGGAAYRSVDDFKVVCLSPPKKH